MNMPFASITYLVNAKCNEQCVFCFNHWREDGYMQNLLHNQKIQVIGRIIALGQRHLAFSGGEPLLDSRFQELVCHARKLAPSVSMSVQTNATLLTRHVARCMKEQRIGYFLVSLHGPERIHNTVTRAPFYRRTIGGIKNAIDANIPVVINTVVTKQNIIALPSFLKELASLGISAVQLSALYAAGSAAARDIFTSFGEQKRLVNTLPQINLPYPLVFHAFEKDVLDGTQWQTDACGAGNEEIAVMPNGDVTLCPAWEKACGNLLRDEWKMIERNIKAMSAQDQAYSCDDCTGCLLSRKFTRQHQLHQYASKEEPLIQQQASAILPCAR